MVSVVGRRERHLLALAPAAKPRGIEIGPVMVGKVITFFDVVVFEYDCYVEG